MSTLPTSTSVHAPPATGHAIVLGASMAGLLAARVLADHYAQVTVLERDPLPNETAPRRGVPQGRQPHGLLAAGLRTLDRLFPGFGAELVQAGGLPGDSSWNIRWYQVGGFKVRQRSDVHGVLASRPLIEGVVRERVRRLPNVQFRDDVSVQGLLHGEGRVRGVQLEDRRQGRHEELSADLTVDATGRGSRSPAWLRALGYAAPAESVVRIDVTYTSQVYQDAAPQHPDDVNAYIIMEEAPHGKRGGVALSCEHGRWMIGLAGMLGEQPPSDPVGFHAYAQALPSPEIARLIERLTPLGAPVTHHFPHSQRRHYERLTRFPEQYLVMGDALCSFNPIYGQGMTVAALEALALQECLRAGGQVSWQRFFKQAAGVIDIPWTLAVGSDLAYPQVEGPRTVAGRLIQRYVRHVHLAAQHDGQVALAFHQVSNLLRPPQSLFRPAVVGRVLRARLGHPAEGHRTGQHVPAR
ncbi:FAD-binding protein [Deinococcus sp. KSM4-11]|uniref:FAD-dependent oxidoreductase n=1 Tax=Deinococcus sp. KSM4-11 TaxID=2568654 RepID=UPI0010A5508C|nr:FAD-binding protein [Deinococcus sp. KSM4-11]THF85520.1 FAD-binding protein [Deinococcus sp. KSM4-11]